jgi:mRNA-degrading endonuclease HigB of HigAB toxin-antitoxin module
MEQIRKKRNGELQKLDVPFMMASERNDQEAVSKIATQKQKLRDIPQKYDLSVFKTPEELKAAWPKELEKEIKSIKKGF